MQESTVATHCGNVRVTWDVRARAAYVQFFAGRVSKTEEVAPGIVADFAADGQLVGLELLNPGRVSPKEFEKIVMKFNVGPVPFQPATIPDLFIKPGSARKTKR